MKAYEIEKIYTDKISEYLKKGYTINPGTMAGHQGEISKIDLKKDGEIIRIMLDNTHCWDRDEDCEVEGVTLIIGRAKEAAQSTRPFDTWQTVWNNELDPIETRLFYQPRNNADFFTEDFEAYKAMKAKQHARWQRRDHFGDIKFDKITGIKATEIAYRYLKRVTGKSRIIKEGIEIQKTIYTGSTKYTISYNRNGYALH